MTGGQDTWSARCVETRTAGAAGGPGKPTGSNPGRAPRSDPTGLAGLGYVHERRSQRAARARGDDPGELLPAVHRVASLAKRWLLGTHQGSVNEAHLPAYLDEFAFRFNRRRSASRGMVFYRVLELAAGHDPVRFQDLLASKKPHAEPPQPPQGRGHPPSMDRPAANWPWRTGELQLQLPIPLRLNEYPKRTECSGERGPRWWSSAPI